MNSAAMGYASMCLSYSLQALSIDFKISITKHKLPYRMAAIVLL